MTNYLMIAISEEQRALIRTALTEYLERNPAARDSSVDDETLTWLLAEPDPKPEPFDGEPGPGGEEPPEGELYDSSDMRR